MNLEQRIIEEISNLSQFGADETGGISRFVYTDVWRAAQQYVFTRMADLGLQVSEDAVGNVFGRTAATNPAEKVILTGSHLDTVRHGGKYDGQFGVICGYLATKLLLEEHGIPKRPIEVVGFAEEEGSRFPYGFWASKNMLGVADKDVMLAIATGFERRYQNRNGKILL